MSGVCAVLFYTSLRCVLFYTLLRESSLAGCTWPRNTHESLVRSTLDPSHVVGHGRASDRSAFFCASMKESRFRRSNAACKGNRLWKALRHFKKRSGVFRSIPIGPRVLSIFAVLHKAVPDPDGLALCYCCATLLGHSSSEVLRQIYLCAMPAEQHRAVEGVEKLLVGPQ